MHSKIREYVFFKLRNDHSKDHLEKKEEITSNIIERYDDIFQKSNDEEYAYVESIKTIGEFLDDGDLEEVAYKPEFAEMLLVSATVLSIISLLATLLNAVAGVVIVGISIALYAVGAVYLYQYSKFTESEEYDINKYQTFLNKTFSYMKTNFIFWSLSLSLIISQLIYSIVLMIATISTIDNMTIEDFFGVYFFALGFFIVFTVIGSVFISLYRRLMKKYTDLSGNDDVQSVGMNARIFLGKKSKKSQNIFLNKWFYSVLNVVVILFLIMDIISTTSSYNTDFQVMADLVAILNSIFIVFYVVVTTLYLLDKIKNHLLIPIFNVVSSIVVFTIWMIVDDIQGTLSINGPFFFLAGIVFIVLLVIDYSINRKIK